MNDHTLIKRQTVVPLLGRRFKVRCRTHLVESTEGDLETVRDWVKSHAQVDNTTAAQMVRSAGRWSL